MQTSYAVRVIAGEKEMFARAIGRNSVRIAVKEIMDTRYWPRAREGKTAVIGDMWVGRRMELVGVAALRRRAR